MEGRGWYGKRLLSIQRARGQLLSHGTDATNNSSCVSGCSTIIILFVHIFQYPRTLFQTPSNALTSMGSRYVELERLKHRPSVFIGPDGKIVNPGDPPPRLAFGSSSSHQDPTCLPCPLCKRTFVTSKGILRHAMRCEHNEANDNFYVRL